MPMFAIRQAEESDSPAIRDLIHQVQINPMSLDWRRFVVAVTLEDELIGCGQIKSHRDGSNELASIAVRPEWRNQGIARAIICTLLQEHPGKLYLTCRSSLGQFYEKFGFHSIPEEEMPHYFRNIRRLFMALTKIRQLGDELLVMVKNEE
jgi:N-acetylglutamate synthase-like GNAT family acetyltransferase